MRLEYHTLDVFTDRVFGGNPLAVFPDGRGLSAERMQAIARELNLSETVFVLPAESPSATRRVRIFTPGAEVPFAGHPTVGTAFFLVASRAITVAVDAVTVVLEEGVGPVPVEVALRSGRPVAARLTAAVAPTEEAVDLDAGDLARTISLDAGDIGAEVPGVPGTLEPVFASAGLPFLTVPVRSVKAAERATLDQGALRQLLGPDAPSRMVYVIASGGHGEDVNLHVRMFAPEIGVPEDPATGSAAAALGGYLGRRAGNGSHSWLVEQGLEMGRPSLLRVEADVHAGAVTAIRVGGSAVLVARATMEIPD